MSRMGAAIFAWLHIFKVRDDHFPFATFDRTFEADEKLFQDGFPLFLLMLANKTHAGQVWLFM